MDPQDIYRNLRNDVRIPPIPPNSWFEYNSNKFLKVSENLALPKQQFEMMGLNFNDNQTSQTLNFDKFVKFLSVSDSARNQTLLTIQKKREELTESHSKCHSLTTQLRDSREALATSQSKCHTLKSGCDKQSIEIKDLRSHSDTLESRLASAINELNSKNAELNSKNAEINLKNAEIDLKNIEIDLKNVEIDSKNQEISRLQQIKSKISINVKSPKVYVPVTLTTLEIVSIKLNKPKLAPSYWAKKGVQVIAKFPSSVWKSVFDSTEVKFNTVVVTDNTAPGSISTKKPIFDVSLNSEYRAVQSIPVSNPSIPPIRPCISLFSFTL